MNNIESKQLKPGMRIRVTAIKGGPIDSAICKVTFGSDWYFPIPSEATLLRLDTSDDNGDWYARFDDGLEYYVEPALVEFEVVE